MGAVWLATDEVLGRTVALKRLAPAHSQSRARVEREARLAARLTHPHVVAVFDLVADGSDQWLVMEYVEGRNLSERVATDGPLSPDEAAPILRQIADALAAAHAAGIVHRDVKPSNILLDATGAAKLTDFGIARSDDADATLTQTGFLTGSPAYLAPEVAAGRPAGPQSDVWALGATAFHALAGHPPYEVGDSMMGTLYRIVHEDPPRTDRAGWLAPMVAGMMTQDPAQRWTLPQVQAFLAGHPSSQAGPTRTLPALAAITPPAGPPPTTAAMPAARPPADASGAARGVAPTGPTDPSSPVMVAPTPGGSAAGRRDGRWVWPAMAGGLVVLVLLVLLLVRPWHHDGGNGTTAGGARTPSTATTPPSSPAASPTSSPSAGPTEDGIRAFVSTYLTTASSDPAQGFAMLTPAYQRQSGGLQGYERFWGNVQKIHDVSDVLPSMDPLGVSYRYTYTLRGAGKRTENVQLRLVYKDGHYLISAG